MRVCVCFSEKKKKTQRNRGREMDDTWIAPPSIAKQNEFNKKTLFCQTIIFTLVFCVEVMIA